MNGLGMMFKAMGFDPAELKERAESMVGEAKEQFDALASVMRSIDSRLQRIEQALLLEELEGVPPLAISFDDKLNNTH